MNKKILLLKTLVLLLSFFETSLWAQELNSTTYDLGSPNVQEFYINPLTGNDANEGTSRERALRTVREGWRRIPQGVNLTRGFRFNLANGEYTEDHLLNYWENRHGTFLAPIILQAEGNGVVFRDDINAFDLRYFYLIGVTIRANSDAVHFEQSNHILLRGLHLDGGARVAHETVKVNQSNFIYIEDSEIHGADDNSIDFVGVQYGHIARNKIYDAADWCAYVKGGSSYITFSQNEVFNCGTGGFTAGQGTGFEFMVYPWIRYEANYVKVVNNLIHDTDGAALGVNGGYNILIAHNTSYNIGRRSHLFEVVFGERGCDGNLSQCSSLLTQGGWGGFRVGGEPQPIPNKNVFVFNNIFFNPLSRPSGYQHLAIYGARSTDIRSQIPNPSRADENLVIRGNIFWNGPTSMPLGIDAGCNNSSCNEMQLRNDNSFNTIEPNFINLGLGDLRTQSIFSGVAIPDFSENDFIPQGNFSNRVEKDYGCFARSSNEIGAFASLSSPLNSRGCGLNNQPAPPIPSPIPIPVDSIAPVLSRANVSSTKIRKNQSITFSVIASDNVRVATVWVNFGGTTSKILNYRNGSYRVNVKFRTAGKFNPIFYANDEVGNLTSLTARPITVR